jgi:hypothetical protein
MAPRHVNRGRAATTDISPAFQGWVLVPLTSTVVAQRQPMLAQPFQAGFWRRVTSTEVAERQPTLAQPFKAAPLGFLWVAIAGIAGCGCRRRIFGGMSQVFKCTLTVGAATA